LVVGEHLRDHACHPLRARVDVLVTAQVIRMVVAHRGTNLAREIIKDLPILDRPDGNVLGLGASYFNSS
jgi:hypothetical protein